MNLDFAKVCGKHSAIYEAYYKQIDPKASGAIEAMTAAKFLKKSGLSDVVLSRVWDLSDPNGKGFLDKPGFFVALKLVSLAQAGQVINMSNIYMETANPPKVGDIPKIITPRIQTVPVSSGGVANGDWSISVIDRLKYEQLFESLKPVGGMLPGNKVKGVLMDSKLPMETLGKIWDLADQDKDGNLDKHEFIVAMHLVYQTLEKRTVPDNLPVELRKAVTGGAPPPKPAPPAAAATMPRAPSGEGFGDGGFVANFPKDIAPPPAIPPLPAAGIRVPPVGAGAPVQPLIQTDPLIPIGAPPSVTANADWVVGANELIRFEHMFRDSDRDKDGLVSGLEVKNVFLQSGVPQNCLAHIWALCDTNQSGKLTLEQFALAMWMVERKQKGIEPPQVLTANMVPPSMRSIVSGVDLQPQAEPKPTYTNPELEMISKEIEELAKERRALETEIAQKEADIRIKSGEVRSLQSELDTLSATLKQLENQRGEAQKRLDDLKAQCIDYQTVLANMSLDISLVRNQVNKIREQCQKQEDTINEQEGELNAKRSELQKLKDEETSLQKEYDENNRELQKLTNHLQNTQLQISSVRSMVTQLMETQRQMTDALLMCRAAIENQDAELVSEYQLKIEPDLDDARKTLEKKIDEPKADPFEDSSNANAIKASNGFASNGFGSDPFTANSAANIRNSGFDDSFNATSGFDSGGFDAFGSNSGFGQKDPFGGETFGKTNAVTPEPGKDDFGSDPFAALHAPTGQGQVLSPNTQKSGPPPRPESPSPALPPKKSKVPPPRPAPPRPVQGPPRPTQPAADAFGSTSTSGGFADFADFDNKLTTNIPTTTLPSSQTNSSSKYAALSDSSLFTDIISTNLSTTTTTTATPASSSASLVSLASTSAFALTTSPINASISTNTNNNSIATTASMSTTANVNHLTRSITPLQQSTNHLITTTTTTTTALAGSNKSKGSSVIKGPTDFSDDPFKDYRYEDPFNIKDPFDDDDLETDPEKVFKDDLSSDDDDKGKVDKEHSRDTTKTSNTSQTFSSAKSYTPDFLEQFENFNLNPSPLPIQQSSTTTGIGASSASVNNISPLPVNTAAGLFDNFADFDAFSTKSSTTPDSFTNNSNTAANNKNNNKANDSFFDAFNDNFDGNANTEAKLTNTNTFDTFEDALNVAPKTKNANKFDAFGTATAAAITTKSTKLFDDFNDNSFEDDFFKNQNASKASTTTAKKDNNFNMNLSNKKTKSSQADNFGNFDAFSDSANFSSDFTTALNNSINLNNSLSADTMGATAATTTPASVINFTKVQNPTTLIKKPNQTTVAASADDGAKLSERYAADYSKPETFDADLEEALKRSMMDK